MQKYIIEGVFYFDEALNKKGYILKFKVTRAHCTHVSTSLGMLSYGESTKPRNTPKRKLKVCAK